MVSLIHESVMHDYIVVSSVLFVVSELSLISQLYEYITSVNGMTLTKIHNLDVQWRK
jgi:hypothetical protein